MTATSITWLGAPGGLGQGGYGCVATTNGGAGTSVTYNGGTLGPGVNGEIKSLIFGVTSGTDFMDFTGASNLIFDLSGFAAGSGTDCIGLTMLLQNCSIQGGPPSPFVLTLVSGGSGICPPGVNVGGFCQTNVLLVVNPSVVRDGLLPNSTWSGSFSTQISTMSPAQIEAVIKTPGGVIGSGEAGSFTISLAPTVPEPVTFVMIGAGLAGLGIMRKRKQRA